VKHGAGDPIDHGTVGGLVGARDEKAVSPGHDGGGNPGDLVRRLALPEDHLRKTLPRRAVVVDPGKPQVLDRVAHDLVGLDGRLSRIEGAVAHGDEERLERLHAAEVLKVLIRQGFGFD
jgi:hypothetical protein